MNYIENIYICLAAPFLIAVLCVKKRARIILLFMLAGMTACIVSSYISTFIASVQGVSLESASLEIAPLVEEIVKLLPIVFCLVVMNPDKDTIVMGVLMTAIGFATFENVCYLAQNGAGGVVLLLIRGFGAGAMHVVCGIIMGTGLVYVWKSGWLRIAGTVGLLALSITFHATYNILISQDGIPAFVGSVLPVMTAVVVSVFMKRIVHVLEN